MAEEQEDAFFTRAALWDMRIQEFESSPLIGVGFASVDPEISTRFDEEEGRVEPGSSWLAVLSMTGLLGFIPIVIMILKCGIFMFKDKNQPLLSAFLGGMLFLFVVHMFAEGYVLSAGSGLFFYFWLTVGMIEAYRVSVKNLIYNT
jgi:O-antigen ligase